MDPSTGDKQAMSTRLRIKEAVVHAGPSQLSHQLSQCTPSRLDLSREDQNSNLLIALTHTTTDAKVVCTTEPGMI